MAKSNTPIAVIYSELTDFVARFIEKKYIFLGNRPKTVADSMQQFVVIDLPAEISDLAIGNDDFLLDTTAVLYIFCRAKTDSTMNTNAQSELTYQVKRGFPITGEHITGTRPRLLPDGYDENNFHITTISFRLMTRPNAFRQ